MMTVNTTKAREPRVHMCTNLVLRPSPPPTTCICILQATKNWSRGKHGNKITSIPHAYVYYPRTRTWVRGYKDQLPTQTIYRAARVWAFTTACRAGRSNQPQLHFLTTAHAHKHIAIKCSWTSTDSHKINQNKHTKCLHLVSCSKQ